MTHSEYNALPAEAVGTGSPIRLEVCETEVDLYWKIAIEVLEVIAENNRKGEDTLMVVPYGPLGPYARLVYLVNRCRVSLRRCTFMNMDEYLTDDGRYIPLGDPLSFRAGMDRTFYSQVDDELNVLPENRCFPDPADPGKLQRLIDRFGKLDMAWGGIGINGHFAFNEPPEPGEACTNEEFLQRGTRVLRISRETKTINCFMNCGGDLDGIPNNCITVGFREMFQARKVRMCMPRDWNAGALRKVLHGPVDCHVPCSLFQGHPDAKLLAARVALASPVPAIRIYNK